MLSVHLEVIRFPLSPDRSSDIKIYMIRGKQAIIMFPTIRFRTGGFSMIGAIVHGTRVNCRTSIHDQPFVAPSPATGSFQSRAVGARNTKCRAAAPFTSSFKLTRVLLCKGTRSNCMVTRTLLQIEWKLNKIAFFTRFPYANLVTLQGSMSDAVNFEQL